MATDAKTGEKIFGRHVAGLQNVGSYQVSGTPFITGSNALASGQEHLIQFDTVTKKVLVRNPGTTNIRVHFASTGSGNVYEKFHFLRVSGSSAGLEKVNELNLECKCTELYISTFSGSVAEPDAVYEVYAELTGIPAARMFALTGSGITEQQTQDH